MRERRTFPLDLLCSMMSAVWHNCFPDTLGGDEVAPLFTVDDVLKSTDLAPRDCATGAVALSAVILAFLYFALGWSTNRMKEADDASSDSRGSPALVCWTSGVGTMSFTILGTHFFAPLYFALNTRIYLWHLLPFAAMLYVWFYFWRCLVRLFILHRKHNGEFSHFSPEMYSATQDYRRGFWFVVSSIFVVGWSTFIETLVGDFPAGIMGVCFFLVAVAGLGCYISLSGDLFSRAVNHPKVAD